MVRVNTLRIRLILTHQQEQHFQIRELGWSIDCNHDDNILKILNFLPTWGMNGIVTANKDSQIID